MWVLGLTGSWDHRVMVSCGCAFGYDYEWKLTFYSMPNIGSGMKTFVSLKMFRNQHMISFWTSGCCWKINKDQTEMKWTTGDAVLNFLVFFISGALPSLLLIMIYLTLWKINIKMVLFVNYFQVKVLAGKFALWTCVRFYQAHHVVFLKRFVILFIVF